MTKKKSQHILTLTVAVICSSMAWNSFGCGQCDVENGQTTDDDIIDDDAIDDDVVAVYGVAKHYSVLIGYNDDIYIAGRSAGSFDAYHGCLSRIESNGNIMWHQCPAAEDFSRFMLGLAASAESYLYATQCVSWSYIEVEDMWVCEAREIQATKYSASGQLIWQTIIAHEEGVPTTTTIEGFVIDTSGRSFVVGADNWVTSGISLNSFGQFAGIAIEPPCTDSIAVDASGEFTLSAVDENDETGVPFVKVLRRKKTHFNSALWSAEREFPAEAVLSEKRMVELAVDLDGSAVLMIPLETAEDPIEYFCLLVKYDNMGQELWSVEQDNCSAYGVVTDDAGTVYLFGNTSGKSSTECFVAKYNSDGALSWSTRLTPDPAVTCDLQAVAFDYESNIYAVGTHVVVLNAQGNENWSIPYSNGAAGAVAVDQDGNAYAVGGSEDSPEITVVKYSPSGTELWTAEFDADSP